MKPVDCEIFEVAEALFRYLGDAAQTECAQMADHRIAQGDHDTAELWRRVMLMVHAMQGQRLN